MYECNAMFNLEYIAASIGVDVQSGGLSVKEEELTVGAGGASVAVSETPVAFDGSLIGWYKLPTDTEWTIGTLNGQVMNIPDASAGQVYCVKYFFVNENAHSITIKTQYVPSELHVVIINDLYSGDIADVSESTRYGRLITDIPRLQMDGTQNLSLTATSAATVSLTGSALAVSTGLNSCEEDLYYGTMTEEIFGSVWQDDVVAIAIENGDVDLAQEGTETLIVRAVFGGSIASQRKDNSNFAFAIEDDPASTATGTTVGANTGLITAGTTAGTCVISVTLNNAPNVEPAYVLVTVE